MGRLIPASFLLLGGCVGFAYESSRVGTPAPVLEARLLEPGRTTLKEALERLGPPDLILRAGMVDRAYWTSWSSSYFKFVLSGEVPLTRGGLSWDGLILSLGSEDLRMARLEFGKGGVLRDVQLLDLQTSRDGESVALDNRIVENFLEDRGRALHALETDDDDEDVELDAPRKP